MIRGMPEMTTIKVPKSLREYVTASAREEGLTSAQFLKRLTDEHARQRRFAAVRRSYVATTGDEDYRQVAAAWDRAVGDGLPDA